MGQQNVSGTGQNKPTVAELRVQINTIKQSNASIDAKKAQLMQLNAQLTQALNGQAVKTDYTIIHHDELNGRIINHVDNKAADNDQNDMITEQREFTNEKTIKTTFGNTTMTEAEFEALKDRVDDLKDKMNDLKDAYEDIKPENYTNYETYQAARETKRVSYQQANADYQAELLKYETEKVRQRTADGKGVKGIRKAAENNVKNMTNVNNVQMVFMSEAEKAQYFKDHPEFAQLADSVKVFSEDEWPVLDSLYNHAKQILIAALEEGDDYAYKQVLAEYGGFLNMFEQKVDPETGKGMVDEHGFPVPDFSKPPNARAIQDVLVDYSGLDHRFNIDESKALAKTINEKEGKVKDFVKTLGFGVEGTFMKKLKAAGIAAGSALVGNLISWAIDHKATDVKTDRADAYAKAVAHGNNAEIITQKIESLNEFGEIITQYQQQVVNTPFVSVDVATDSAEAVAKAVADLPILGQLAGPALAGIAAFVTCKPQTEDAFMGVPIDEIIDSGNITLIKDDDNRAIMLEIMDMEITGNKDIDKRIKNAVLNAAIGKQSSKANTEELLAAYTALVQTKEAYDKIPTKPEEPVTPATEKTPEPEPPKPTTTHVAGRGLAVDHALLKRHGANTPVEFNNVNVPSGRAQFVIAEENGELQVTLGAENNYAEPDEIIMTDNTNNKLNTYTYRKLTEDEIAEGKTKDGKNIKKSELQGPGPHYILVSVIDENGEDLMNKRFAEVYTLEHNENETTGEDGNITVSHDYKLHQHEGYAGSNRSSMKYHRRAK